MAVSVYPVSGHAVSVHPFSGLPFSQPVTTISDV
jgi:hypothetical protein